LERLLRILERDGAELALVPRERDRPAGFSHVVGATARLARLLDRKAVEEVVRVALARDLRVHRSPRVARVPPLEHDDRSGRLAIAPGDPETAALTEQARDRQQLAAAVAATPAALGENARLVLPARPPIERADIE